MAVPQYGTHDGIKYTPRRTIIGICQRCGNIFLKIGKGSGAQKYCGFTCSEMTNIEKTRDNWQIRNKYKRDKNQHAEEARKARNANKWQDNNMNKQIGNIKTPGAPQEDWTTEQWMAYHKKIQQHKKHTLKQAYD